MEKLVNFLKNPIFITLIIITIGTVGLYFLVKDGKEKTYPDAPYVERFWGKADAKVVVEEHGDFLCPFCLQFNQGGEAGLKENYLDQIKFVYKHFPIHNGASRAAQAAEAAGDQGKFWEYHDLLFSKQTAEGASWDSNKFTEYAKELGLDTTKFKAELVGGKYEKIVTDSETEARNRSIPGTPYIEVNGKRVTAPNGGTPSYEDMKKAVDAALESTSNIQDISNELIKATPSN
jgi:protein-disulfide isomerase